VEIGSGESSVSGIVEAVTSGSFPQVLVNGQYYDFSQVQKVKRDLKE
jgi:hypothetical protein